MQCPEIKELLSAWLDGETPAAESAAVAAHLEVCPSCRREAAVLQRLDEALGGLTAPIPGDLAARVRARLPRPRHSWYRSVALAACLVLGLGLGGGLTQYFYAPPGNGEGQELASLEIFQDFPQGSLGTAISFPGEEDNHT